MKIAVLVDSDRTITRWQFEALKQVINDGHEINLIAVAKGDGYRTAIKPKYFLYYVLALFSRYRSVHLERISISEIGIENISKIDFVREISGMWEEIPKSFLPEFSRSDVVIKFGMGLLRI